MRSAFVVSLLVHVVIVSVLFVVRPPRSIVVPGPDAVQVSLIDPSAFTANAPAPSPAPQPPPPDDQGVRLPDTKRPSPKPPTPTHETTPPPVVPAPKPQPPAPTRPQTAPSTATPGARALPAARVGAVGLMGSVGVDDADFEFTYYLVLIRNRIASNWQPPAGLATGGAPVRAVVVFTIGRDGSLSGTRLESVSGAEPFDRAALRAVVLSDPLPPLPLGFSAGSLGVHFGFEWESP